ncbi:chaperone modulator CbpM [Epilithonimonas hungarica]|uniref:MerR HTH family regulatory protein n=1 Tax=Epilithonimonas hungarica TaxID=454006 RepID=A0A1G7NF61_9FLAO|nr:chaperone modulator CbpM [Epilithonimonas hungarica]SDF72547.1 MerR HTH family regulatory protein [Epilithonimonas hungarica]
MNERISIEEIIRIYKIDHSFLDQLIDLELLHPETDNRIRYIIYEELPHLERFANWHYDLDINLPGIEIIHRLLNQLEDLKNQNRRLLQNVSKFENWEDAEI